MFAEWLGLKSFLPTQLHAQPRTLCGARLLPGSLRLDTQQIAARAQAGEGVSAGGVGGGGGLFGLPGAVAVDVEEDAPVAQPRHAASDAALAGGVVEDRAGDACAQGASEGP